MVTMEVKMKAKWLFATALLLVSAMIIAAGCSKKDSGTNARTLTPEEQFATFEQYTGGVENVGPMTVPLIASSAGNQFWDGVDQWDTPDFGLDLLGMFIGGGSSRPGIDGLFPGALGKRSAGGRSEIESRIARVLSAAVTESGAYEYDATRGWWIADLDTSMAFDFDTLGTALHLSMAVNLRDSVRFDNSISGTPSEQPNLLTNRLRHGTRTNLSIGLTLVSGDTLNVNLRKCELGSTGSNTLTGLNGSEVTLTGSSSFTGDVDLSATVPDTLPGPGLQSTTAKGTLGLANSAQGVVMDNSSEPCPTDGSVNSTLSLDLSTSLSGESRRASGSWDMSIQFTGGGNASVSVSSGDFSDTAQGQVCEPPI